MWSVFYSTERFPVNCVNGISGGELDDVVVVNVVVVVEQAVDAAGHSEPRRQQRRPGHHVVLAESDEPRDDRQLHGAGEDGGSAADTLDLLVKKLTLHGTEVAFLLLNHQPWARFSAFPRIYLLMLLRFIDGTA